MLAAAVTAALLQAPAAQAVSDPGTPDNSTAKRLDNRPGPLTK